MKASAGKHILMLLENEIKRNDKKNNAYTHTNAPAHTPHTYNVQCSVTDRASRDERSVRKKRTSER